jgi:psp operon transcriptional activator
MAGELGRDLFAGFTPRARDALLAHQWPGNVRELKNVVERCVYRTPQDQPVDDIVFDPFDSPFRPRREATAAPDQANGATPDATGHVSLPLDLKASVQDFEIALIERAMREGRHNQRKAAELLGLTYHQLRGYLKKYELLKKD